MTDQEFNEYLEKYQPEFEGNKEHLKILIEYKMLPIDIENIDLKDYPAGARGHFFAVPVVIVSLVRLISPYRRDRSY